MYQCPISFFTKNIIFNQDKSAWAVYKLSGFDYDFLDDDAKIKILHKTARFLSGILSEAQILMLPIEQDIQGQFESLRHHLDKKDPLYEGALFHLNETEKYLAKSTRNQGDANDYSSYIVVKLSDSGEYELLSDLKQGFQYFIKDPVNAINTFMALDTRDILETRLTHCADMADKWFYSQNKKLQLVPVDGLELQWLIRRGSFRGISGNHLFYADRDKHIWNPVADQDETQNGEKILHPYSKDIVSLFSGSIHQEKRYLKVVHDKNRVSYQTFLVFTHIPEVLEHPGNEWLYMLQQMNVQAEVCIHIKTKDYREAIRKVESKKMEIDSQMEHIAGAGGDIPDDLADGKEYADILEAELKSQRYPLLETVVTIGISADNLEEMEKKAVTVRGIYEDFAFGIERPLADQLKLFMQCIPGMGVLTGDYTMPLTPVTLGSGIIGATHELGDHVGPYIGTTGAEGKQVFLDLGRACLLNKSASATFYGNLGVGKSFNANLLLFLTVLYGGYGLIFDPKGERSHWVEQFPLLQGQISLVTLSPDRTNQGKLDPYNMYLDNRDEADELAINVISELLRIAPASEEYTAILEAQRIMRDEDVPSMKKLIAILKEFPREDELSERARYLARRLGLQAETGMSRLLFGDGSEDAITLKNRLNILQIENLKMPSPSTPKDNYTSEELQSLVLMAVASHFAKKFALEKRDVFSVVLFDESWMLGKTAEGVKLFDYLSRMGRSLYTGCIFNGHSVTDIPSEGIKNTISYKFCFQTTTDGEAERMCEYMDLEATQENKEVLKNLKNGECLFQDLDRHIGILRFDAVFQDIIDLFSTTPKAKGQEEEQEAEQIDQTETEESRQSEKKVEENQTETMEDKLNFEFDMEELLKKESV